MTIKLPQGTPMLALDSPTFVEDFAKAIDLQPGEKLEIMTPQFERTDGVQVTTPDFISIADFEALPTKDLAFGTKMRMVRTGCTRQNGTRAYPMDWKF